MYSERMAQVKGNLRALIFCQLKKLFLKGMVFIGRYLLMNIWLYNIQENNKFVIQILVKSLKNRYLKKIIR